VRVEAKAGVVVVLVVVEGKEEKEVEWNREGGLWVVRTRGRGTLEVEMRWVGF
jgi:hypothetical protein